MRRFPIKAPRNAETIAADRRRPLSLAPAIEK